MLFLALHLYIYLEKRNTSYEIALIQLVSDLTKTIFVQDRSPAIWINMYLVNI